jgi:hypothetical protein
MRRGHFQGINQVVGDLEKLSVRHGIELPAAAMSASAPLSERRRMKSIFTVASRRVTVPKEFGRQRRDGALKMCWTKPPCSEAVCGSRPNRRVILLVSKPAWPGMNAWHGRLLLQARETQYRRSREHARAHDRPDSRCNCLMLVVNIRRSSGSEVIGPFSTQSGHSGLVLGTALHAPQPSFRARRSPGRSPRLIHL